MCRHVDFLSFKTTPWLIWYYQSFANVSNVTTDQLQSLPGFGQVKVRNVKNAFEKPFRNQTTTSLSQVTPQKHKTVVRESSQAEAVHQDQSTGDVSRESSPIWDIELDEGDLPSRDNWDCNQILVNITFCSRERTCVDFIIPSFHSNCSMKWEKIHSLSLCDFSTMYINNGKAEKNPMVSMRSVLRVLLEEQALPPLGRTIFLT